ncbi:MAG: zeta toxin [Rhodospirillales bacterium]|nr:zeta toxin [Rhodospirillales bacterium]
MRYLPEIAHCRRFVNADLIAAGLSPLDPESVWIGASRLFLKEIEDSVGRKQDFAFETTLSGRGYLNLIARLHADGWRIHLFYLWLPDVEMAVERVHERASHGGHTIAENVVRRRFPRSLRHLMQDYAPLCDLTVCLDNSRAEPALVFARSREGVTIYNRDIHESLERMT